MARIFNREINFRDFSTTTNILIGAVIAFSSIFIIKYQLDLRSRASSRQPIPVQLSLTPEEVRVEKDNTFILRSEIVPQSEKKIVAVILSLSFNPNAVQLERVHSDPNDKLLNLKYSQHQRANSEGRLKIFLGARSLSEAPSGSFELTKFKFRRVSENASIISLVRSELQVVFGNGEIGMIDISRSVKIRPQEARPATIELSPTGGIGLLPETIIPTLEESSEVKISSVSP